MTSVEDVFTDDDGHVRTVTLNRPDRHNAFTPAGYRALAEVLHAAAAEEGVRVVLLAGAGPSFCSGVDLGELARSGSDLSDFDASFHTLLQALTTFPKPLLAAVHGAAVGFGFTILLHCDIVVVADDARMRAPFAALGTTPEAGSSLLLPRLVGPQRAAELLFTGRWLAAEEALSWGLAARVVAREALGAEAAALAHSVAAQPPRAVAAAKSLILLERADEVEKAMSEERRAAIALGGLQPM